MSVACVVLCGGRSSRMGRDKAFLPFGERDLAHFVYARCKEVFAKSFLCFKTPKPNVNLPMIVESLHSQTTQTHSPNSQKVSEGKDTAFSPLHGIACALRELKSAYVAFMSVDTPFVNPKILYTLYEQVRECGANGGYIVQVDEAGALVREHYLLCVWRKDRLDSLTRAIEAGDFVVGDLVRELGFITYVVCDEGLSHNLNTPQDYQHALKNLPRVR